MSYRFGDCELDAELRTLRRRGTAVRLQPKVFELLHLLILHRARVLSKWLLLRELWPDSHVTTASLTRLVKEARRGCGDDGRGQRVIQTVHGFGYRFVAPLEACPEAGRAEGERAIDLARRSMEAALDHGGRDLRERVRDFAELCRMAVQTARREAG